MNGAGGTIRKTALLALVLLAAGWICRMTWVLQAPVALVWLPAGIAVAALGRFGLGLWPAVPFAAGVVPLLAGRPLVFVAAAALANLALALSGAWLLRRGAAPSLARLPGVALLVRTALLASVPAALIGGAGVLAYHSWLGLAPPPVFRLALGWYGSDVLGILLAAPPILLWSGVGAWKRALRQRGTVVFLGGMALLVALFSAGGSVVRGGAGSFSFVLVATGLAALVLPLEVAFAGAFVASAGILASYVNAIPATADGPVLFASLAANTAIVLVTTLVVGAAAAERQERDGALVRSEERYRRLVDAVPVGILLHDGEMVLFANPQAQRALLGPGETSLTGRAVKALLPAAPESSGKAFPVAGRPGRASWSGRLRLVRSDGTAVESEATSEEMAGEEGRPLVLLAFRDVGEQVALENEKRRFAERTKQAARLESLGLLSGGIAHDFNNLLTAILGNTALVRAGLPSGGVEREALETIQIAATRAADLTAQLLAFSGRHDREAVPVPVRPAVEEALRLLRPAISPGIECRVDAPDGIRPVQADPTQFRSILGNLLKNAAEAMGAGPGTITVRVREVLSVEKGLESPYLEETPPAGSYLRIEVEDTGAGMGREEASRMFDPFFSTKRPGRGLGLAAVLGIVKAHGGTLQVESAIGKGTTVRLFLPPSQKDAAVPVGRTPTDTLRWLPMKGSVLVVDSDGLVVETICRTLRRLGLEPSSASRVAEAESFLAEAPSAIRVVFVEDVLSDETGRSWHRRLRAERPDLPIVLLAEKNGPRPAMRASPLRKGALLLKPFEAADVREAFVLALEGAAGRPSAAAPKG